MEVDDDLLLLMQYGWARKLLTLLSSSNGKTEKESSETNRLCTLVVGLVLILPLFSYLVPKAMRLLVLLLFLAITKLKYISLGVVH